MGRHSENVLGKAVAEKIGYQFPPTPEGRLFSCVIRQAMLDVSSKSASGLVVASARRYLSQEMPHAELCGVDSDWMRNVLKRAGVNIYARD